MAFIKQLQRRQKTNIHTLSLSFSFNFCSARARPSSNRSASRTVSPDLVLNFFLKRENRRTAFFAYKLHSALCPCQGGCTWLCQLTVEQSKQMTNAIVAGDLAIFSWEREGGGGGGRLQNNPKYLLIDLQHEVDAKNLIQYKCNYTEVSLINKHVCI